MRLRHVVLIVVLAVTAIALWGTATVTGAFNDDDPANESHPQPATPTTHEPGTVELIPHTDAEPRHPVDLDVANEPEAVAKACGTAIWSWDTVTDNSPADAAARCAPLATDDVAEQLHQRVTGVTAQWTELSRDKAWISVDVEAADTPAGDLGYRGRPVTLYILQTAHTTQGTRDVPGTPQVTFDVVQRDGTWKIGGIRYE